MSKNRAKLKSIRGAGTGKILWMIENGELYLSTCDDDKDGPRVKLTFRTRVKLRKLLGMMSKCFCGGHGSYTDYNVGQAFEVRCPHCKGTGTKSPQCKCEEPVLTCGGSRGEEIDTNPDSRTTDQIEDDDIHWNFMD